MFRPILRKGFGALALGGLVVQCDGYREQILGNYENRVRAYSHPLKVFQYFASLNNEYMTMEDFVRSLIPYNSKDHVTRNTKINIPKTSSLLLADLNKDGKISFDEYVFYLSLLTIPLRSLKSAFNLFDKNNSGGVDDEELQEMLLTFSRQSAGFSQRIGSKQAVHPTDVIKSLFGDTDVVKFRDFENFVKSIKSDLLKIEFDLYSKNGTINLKDFAYIITNYAHPTKQIELGERIQKLPESNFKMKLDEFLSFNEALSNIDEFNYAIKLFSKVFFIHVE
eukprot:NODE_8_length_66115_cov_0.981823.p25 type:complete len:280 gc:universal NODE_8_length_66115_cov_0.981823:24027-23188(-)